ncbi:MAG: hypothetical protein FWF30_04730, partial [Coriobacteriia bacterium]|nr:hypothetical protein [Coriobacteriia bacterium]
WGEQFVGTAMNPTMGNTPIYIYSLVEANKFFGAGNTNLGTLSGSSRVGISWVEPPEFISWVRDSLKDTELAKAIEQALADAPGPSGQADADGATNAAVSPILPYLRQANIIAELVQIRLYQLKEALGSAE